ncbi:MAG: hypothetical protein U0575_16005 [Phycisphaerales bacterium]|jgi:hypothetical protein
MHRCSFAAAAALSVAMSSPAQTIAPFFDWYDAALAPDGTGTFDIVDVSRRTVMGSEPEAIVYVGPDNPGFAESLGPDEYILVTKYLGGRIDVYPADDNGDPQVGFEVPFVNGLYGAEGMAFDPISGDLVVSTYAFPPYGGDEVFVIRGFVAPVQCIGNLTGDGVVDGADLGVLLGAWGACPG